MSRTFQSNNLNLFSIEGHVQDYTAALSRLKEDPFSGGYFFILNTTFANLGISVTLTEADFLPKIKRYILLSTWEIAFLTAEHSLFLATSICATMSQATL